MTKAPNVHVVTATEAKNKFGAILKSADAPDEHWIVERNGIPVVAIVPMAEYQQFVIDINLNGELAKRVDVELRRAKAGRERKKVLAQIHAKMPIVSEEEGDRDIARAIRETRNEAAQKAGLPKPLPYRQFREPKKRKTKSA